MDAILRNVSAIVRIKMNEKIEQYISKRRKAAAVMPKYISIEDASYFLGISRDTAYRMARSGDLPTRPRVLKSGDVSEYRKVVALEDLIDKEARVQPDYRKNHLKRYVITKAE